MIALDTNVLARYYVASAEERDRAEQQAALATLSAERPYFVSADVALELAWVLIGPYQCDAPTVQRVFEHLMALPNVTFEEAAAFAQATAWHVGGLDFADALHLARTAHCTRLETFDRRFAKDAARLGLSPPVATPVA
jgi:predicted nucleic-acid-binding protein